MSPLVLFPVESMLPLEGGGGEGRPSPCEAGVIGMKVGNEVFNQNHRGRSEACLSFEFLDFTLVWKTILAVNEQFGLFLGPSTQEARFR